MKPQKASLHLGLLNTKTLSQHFVSIAARTHGKVNNKVCTILLPMIATGAVCLSWDLHCRRCRGCPDHRISRSESLCWRRGFLGWGKNTRAACHQSLALRWALPVEFLSEPSAFWFSVPDQVVYMEFRASAFRTVRPFLVMQASDEWTFHMLITKAMELDWAAASEREYPWPFADCVHVCCGFWLYIQFNSAFTKQKHNSHLKALSIEKPNNSKRTHKEQQENAHEQAGCFQIIDILICFYEKKEYKTK